MQLLKKMIVIDFLGCFLQCMLSNPRQVVTGDKCVSETFLQVPVGVGARSRNSVVEISSKLGNPVGR